jgi:hypothetical protein
MIIKINESDRINLLNYQGFESYALPNLDTWQSDIRSLEEDRSKGFHV